MFTMIKNFIVKVVKAAYYAVKSLFVELPLKEKHAQASLKGTTEAVEVLKEAKSEEELVEVLVQATDMSKEESIMLEELEGTSKNTPSMFINSIFAHAAVHGKVLNWKKETRSLKEVLQSTYQSMGWPTLSNAVPRLLKQVKQAIEKAEDFTVPMMTSSMRLEMSSEESLTFVMSNL